MTITVDLASESYRSNTATPFTFSHGGAASGVKGILLSLTHGGSNTDHVSAASYGGVSLAPRTVRASTNTTEPGATEWWFLGTSVPQGTQTVSYTPGSTGEDIQAVCITLLGDADLEVIDTDTIINTTGANPSLTLQNSAKAGTSAMAFASLYSGLNAIGSLAAGANCTLVHDVDLGSFTTTCVRQTTAQTGTGDFTISVTAASSDVAFAALVVAEKASGGGSFKSGWARNSNTLIQTL